MNDPKAARIFEALIAPTPAWEPTVTAAAPAGMSAHELVAHRLKPLSAADEAAVKAALYR
jgi:hypothetical protein